MSNRIRWRIVLLVVLLFILAACRQERIQTVTPAVNMPTADVTITLRATPVAVGAATVEASPTSRSVATATDVPATERPELETSTATVTVPRTVMPAITATATAPPASAGTPVVQPPSPTSTQETSLPDETPVAPVIHDFRLVAEEEMNPGKRLTFTWSVSGESAMLVAGTRQRFIPWWQVPLSGTMTIELGQTLFRDPGVSLTVTGTQNEDGTPGEQAIETITIPWACEHEYFFAPVPQRCARDGAVSPAAAQQEFEGGRMIWLQPENKIIVLFDHIVAGSDAPQMRVYDDTWAEGEPESDPEIEPPANRVQPVRGFGKVWRENLEVREGLGWASGPESAYATTWQFEFNESIGTTSYLQLRSGEIVRLIGYHTGFGSWSYLNS